ncbi:MAG: YbfB/YjiJ family MFS transporter [Pseudomonadota bacterium]
MTDVAPRPNQPAPWTIALAGALSLAVAMGIGRFAFTPMLPLMIGEGQIDIAAAGWVAAANYAGYLAGAVTAPRLRWSAVRLGIVALVLTVLLTAAMALPVSAWIWGALRFVAGVCSAWAFIATAVWCLGALARIGKPAWSSFVYTGVGLGIAGAGLYCLAGASLAAPARSLWLQLGALAAVLALPVMLVLSRMGAAPVAAPSQKAGQKPSGRNTGLVISYGMLGFGYILPATFLPVLARSVVEDPRLFGLAWPVFGTTAALSVVVGAWLLLRMSRLKIWAASNVLMALGVLLPSVWLNGWTIALSALLVGGTFMVVTLAGVQEIRARTTGDPTAAVSRMTAAFAIGQIAGPVFSSLLLHVPGFRETGLTLALQAAALSLVVCAAWLWREAHRMSLAVQEKTHAR